MVTRIVDGNNANRLMLLEAEDGGELVTARNSAQGIYDFSRLTSSVVCVHSLEADSVGLAQTGLQRLDYMFIGESALQVGDKLRITVAGTKNGAADTCAFSIRVGSTNSSADSPLATGPAMTTTNTAVGTQMMFRVASDAELKPIGSTATVNSLASASNGALKSNIAIPSISTAGFYIGLYASMTAGTEAPTATEFMVEVIPGGN